MNDQFDLSEWQVPEPSSNKQNGTLPFSLLRKLDEGTTVLWILDARPVRCYQHFNGGKKLLICSEDNCPFCRDDTRREEFWFTNVLIRAKGKVKVWRYTKNPAGELHKVLSREGDPRKYDVGITRTGTGRNTRYNIVRIEHKVPVQVDKSKLYDLEKLLQPMSEDEMKKYLNGSGDK